ncbi:MAG: hypothetical protein VB092_09635 [Oscillospiraceae bacterium]|nr:hypothetical protein [Oscillospiraceae bacterium]
MEMREGGQQRQCAGAVCFAVLLAVFPAQAKQGLLDGLDLCYTVLVPSLFPFLFVADYLWALLRPAFQKSRPLCLCLCVLFSLCGGFPMGAKVLSQAEAMGFLNKKQASLLLAGCVNAGPAYLISGVGVSLFGSARAGIYLFISLSLASLTTLAGIFLFYRRDFRRCGASPAAFSGNAPASFAGSLAGAVRATAGLCAYVVLFSCAGSLFFHLLKLLRIQSVFVRWLFTALCEVSSACAFSADVGSILGLYLALACVSLCGVSVLLQVRALTQQSGLSLRPLLCVRPVHLLLSSCILHLLLSGTDSTPVLAQGASVAARLFCVSPAFSFFLFLLSVIFVGGKKKLPLFTN